MYEFKTESVTLAGNNIPGIHHGIITEMFKLSRIKGPDAFIQVPFRVCRVFRVPV